MITVGVDLAAEVARTALAVVEWDGNGAFVRRLTLRATDADIAREVAASDKAGIDCPFGWPAPFVALVAAHAVDQAAPPPDSGREWRRTMVSRETDRFVQAQTGITPLSVSADRIAHVALRCASLLARMGASGIDCRRDGSGRVAEVYPAAALFRWQLSSKKYKRAENVVGLGDLVDALLCIYPRLRLGEFEAACRASDDAFDAVICAMVARSAALGLTDGVVDRGSALTEGWIHLPTGRMPELLPEPDPPKTAPS